MKPSRATVHPAEQLLSWPNREVGSGLGRVRVGGSDEMWWCHVCGMHFNTDVDQADQVRCTGCGEAFVEFMPHATPLSMRDEEEEYNDEYEEEGDELYDMETLQSLFFNSFFGDSAARNAQTTPSPEQVPVNTGASEEAMEALPSVNLTDENVANEPEVRICSCCATFASLVASRRAMCMRVVPPPRPLHPDASPSSASSASSASSLPSTPLSLIGRAVRHLQRGLLRRRALPRARLQASLPSPLHR